VRTRNEGSRMDPGSHQPRVILSQARVHSMLLDAMKKFNGQTVDYGCRVLGVEVDGDQVDSADAYPVTVRVEKDGKEEKFKAKYVLVNFITFIRVLAERA